MTRPCLLLLALLALVGTAHADALPPHLDDQAAANIALEAASGELVIVHEKGSRWRLDKVSATTLGRYGLQDGDVVTAIDKQPITKASQFAKLWKAARSRGVIDVTLERGGKIAVQVILLGGTP